MQPITEKIKSYIEENKHQDIHQLILKGSPFKEVNIGFLIQQINARNKLSKKLPTWVENDEVVFPPQINLEQTSSEATAKYKSKLIKGNTIIDLTGGFGVDSYYFSKRFKKVTHLEINKELIDLARHNAPLMGVKNIEFLNKDSIDYLSTFPTQIDAIYVDPSRRDQNKSKVFQLKDCTPDIIKNWNLIASKTNQLLIKTSPFLDIKLGLKELKNVVEVHIVSVKNEVKELLWLINFNCETTSIPKLVCVDLKKDQVTKFEGNFSLEQKSVSTYSFPKKYLYEPMSSVMKSGMFNWVGEFFKLEKLDINTHLYTHSEQINTFSGKVFEITEVLEYKTKLVKKRLKSMKLNVVKKNFPILVKDLIQKFNIKEGGEDFVFFTTSQGKKIVILCKRIS